MAAISVQVPYPVFYDRDGQPLDNGNIYIGDANQDPVTNPLQVYFDEALTIPASQPLKTSGGYVYRNGTPAQLYVDAVNFSISVKDDKGLLVYNFPSGTGLGVGAGLIEYDPPFTGAVTSNYTVADKLSQCVSVKDFGAVGDGVTDDTTAIQNAIDSLPSTGGALYFPTGTYLVSSAITINKPGVYYGDGWATNIRSTSASANIFTCTDAEQIQIEQMRFTSSVTRSGGWYVDVAASANRFRLSDFAMDGAIGGIRTAAVATATFERGQILNCVATTGVAVRINAGFDVTVRDIICDQGAEIFAGVLIKQAGDVTLEDLQLLNAGQALYLEPNAGQVISSLWANNCFFDNATRGAYLFANGGTIVRTLFDQCWFSSSIAEGVRLSATGGGSISGTDFNGCHVFQNSGDGISITSTSVTDTRIHDCSIAANAGNGVSVAAGVGSVSIQDCRIGNCGGLSGNAGFGVALIVGAGNNIQVLGNDLRGNTGANLSNAATGANIIVANNLGANEVWTSYTPTVGAASGTITTLGTVSGAYQKIGKQLFLQLVIPITTNGTAAIANTATLPSGMLAAIDCVIAGRENSVSGAMLQGIILATSGTISITRYDNAYAGADGTRFVMTGVIEVQ